MAEIQQPEEPPTLPLALRISVIIPAVNEGSNISQAVESARAAGIDEIIVADGGSTDETCQLAAHAGAHVVNGLRGRARQLNTGARQATGSVLLFLHADARLSVDCGRQIQSAFRQHPQAVAGAFRQRIAAEGFVYRCLERGNACRARRLRRPYGDQAIFVRADWFRAVSGFPEVPILEEILLMRQLPRRTPFLLLDGPVKTSARRWQQHGVVRQTWRNWTILAGFWSGIPLARLSTWYRPHDAHQSSSYITSTSETKP